MSMILYYRLIFLSSLLWTRAQFNPIVGGRLVLKPDIIKYSYIVSLQEKLQYENVHIFQHFCGGSLISFNWVITAAHCIDGKNTSNVVAVIGKENLLFENVRKYRVLRYEYNNFNSHLLLNDIALIKIDGNMNNFKTNHNMFINLPKDESKPNGLCQILGYGASKYGGNIVNSLYVANVSLITNEDCRKQLGYIMAPHEGDNKICALGNWTDTCQGDSGGPLICSINGTTFIYGIVSQGMNCGLNGVPSIYTIVDKYLNWIKKVVFEN